MKSREEGKHLEILIREILNGECVTIHDSEKDYVKKQLREIKKNCTIVLSQLSNKNY